MTWLWQFFPFDSATTLAADRASIHPHSTKRLKTHSVVNLVKISIYLRAFLTVNAPPWNGVACFWSSSLHQPASRSWLGLPIRCPLLPVVCKDAGLPSAGCCCAQSALMEVQLWLLCCCHPAGCWNRSISSWHFCLEGVWDNAATPVAAKGNPLDVKSCRIQRFT